MEGLSYVEAQWSPEGGAVPAPELLGVQPENSDLHAFLFDVAGRYLACANGAPNSPISFSYCLYVVRGQSDGFLRLDVSGTVVVAGFDRAKTSRDEMIRVAATYAQAARGEMGFSFLPPVTFGATKKHAYYITSPYGLATAHPKMLIAALRFIAEYLVLPGCGDDLSPAVDYVDGIADGRDPLSVLDQEPLVALIIAGTPPEVQDQTRREVSQELRRLLID